MEIGLRNPDIGSLAGYLTVEDSTKRSVGYQALADVIARFLITFKDKEDKGIYDINNQKFINCFLNMLNEATIIDMSYLKFLIKNTLSFLEYRNNEDFISAVTGATSYTEIIFLDRFFTKDTIKPTIARANNIIINGFITPQADESSIVSSTLTTSSSIVGPAKNETIDTICLAMAI